MEIAATAVPSASRTGHAAQAIPAVDAVEDGQVHGLVRGLVEVVEVGPGRLPQAALARGEQAQLEQPHAEAYAARGPLDDAPRVQFGDEAVHGRLRDRGTPAQLPQ